MAVTRPPSAVMHRDMRAAYPFAVGGDGVYVTDGDGKRYLDACGGAAVCCLGYGNKRVLAAMRQQMEKIAFIHSGFFTTEAMEALAQELVAHAPGDGHFSHVYLVSDGSEAVEAALKMARQYYLEIGEPRRRVIIARRQSYHGNTLGALAAGGNLSRRRPFAPLLLETRHIAPCYAYRHRRADETEEAYGRRAAQELEDEILRAGAENVLAFIAEPVVGATTGAVPAAAGYFRRIREICDRYGVLLILDEVMCGMGRVGTLHACEYEGVVGDLQTVAKGIAAGYMPLGAVFVGAKIAAAIEGGEIGAGAFRHGHTFMGHALACAAGLATQQEVRERGLVANVRRQGESLIGVLREQLGRHPFVGDIRGRGLLIGVELVADRAAKKPFDPALKIHQKIKTAAMRQGLMCYPAGGTADGMQGDHVLLAPPYIIEDSHIAEISDKLCAAIDEATARGGAG